MMTSCTTVNASVFRLVALVLFAPVPCSAQAPAAIAWERLGSGSTYVEQDEIQGIAFRRGVAPDGSLDTLYAINGYGVFRFSSGAEEWEEMCHQCVGEYMTATKEGYLLIGSRAGPTREGSRSTDGGRTWEREVIGVSVTVLFQTTLPSLGGAVFACNGAYCARSFDGGAAGSWLGGEPMGGSPAALGEVTSLAALSNGRLLGGAWNGAAYSDDGGQTWTPSSLWQAGRFVVNSITFAPIPEHPFGGIAYAGVRDFGLGRPAVYQSEDAGLTWTLVLEVNPGDYGLAGPDWIVVQASPEPGGTVYAGVEDTIAGTAPSVGTVLASAADGQTWVQVADSTNGWGGWAPRVFEMARDGRLYTGTDRGVWRTVEPVITVSVEDEPAAGKTGIGLEVYPNPSSQAATVVLTLAEPQEVQVTVYDPLGRQVAVLAAGRLAAGVHNLAFNASALAANIYLVQAEVAAHTLTRHLTLVR